MGPKSVSIVCVGLLVLGAIAVADGDDVPEMWQALSDMVEDLQMKEDTPYEGLGQSLQQEGNYYFYLRINSHGKCEMSLLRREAKVSYLSSFVSGLITKVLIDAHLYGKAPAPSKESMTRIANYYTQFHPQYFGYNTSVVYFFDMAYDPERDIWYQRTSDLNLIDTGDLLKGLPGAGLVVSDLVYGENLPPNLGAVFAPKDVDDRYYVPPDFDSVNINLIYGTKMYETRDYYQEAWQIWDQNNQNLTSVFDAVKKFAYRPFSDDPAINTIDPRTYYLVRDFLDEAKANGKDVAFISTWVTDLDQQRWLMDNLQMAMPWFTNNVDLAIIANFLSNTIAPLTVGLIDPDVFLSDPDLSFVFESSADLMIHMIKNNFANYRIDILLVYYPPPLEVYWFIARGLMYIESYHVTNGTLPVPLFEVYYSRLAEAMRNDATGRLLEMATAGENGDFFYDDFFGNADLSYYDVPIERHEDRIFSTSMGANALLYTWTVYDKENGLRWIDSTPQAVKDTVYGCSQWLEANTLTGEFLPDSPFFTRDVHSFESIPYWYPYNMFEYLNGTEVEDNGIIPAEYTQFAVRGYIEPDEYEELLKIDQFGVPTPTEFTDYNHVNGSLLFWSSHAYTYASVLMTLSMTSEVDTRE